MLYHVMSQPTAHAVEFRLARHDDIEPIRAIEQAAGRRFAQVNMAHLADRPPASAANIRQRIDAVTIVVAVDANGRCVGFAAFEWLAGELADHGDATRIYLAELDVLPSHAGQRIGAALIDWVAQFAHGQGATQLMLSTFREVPWNAPYYRKLGFRTIDDAQLDAALLAIRDEHIGRGLDESQRVFMYRTIVAPQ